MKKRRKIAIIPLVLGGILLSQNAWAAPAIGSPGDIEASTRNNAGIQINRMREYMERERVREQIAEDRARAKEKAEEVKTEEQPQGPAISFELQQIVTGPSEVLTSQEIEGITKPYLGQKVQLADVYKIVGALNDLYHKKGYVNCRAFLPPQKVEKGIVKLLLVEGHTGETDLQGNKYTKDKYILKRLHLTKDKVANMQELNKDLLLFNATNSTQLRIVMKAGKTSGTTDYEIRAYEPKQYTTTVLMDNAGSYTSGEARMGLFFNTRSLSGNCDPLTIGTVLSQGAKAVNGTYSRSLGRSGTKLNLLYSTNAVKTVKGDYEDMVLGHASSYGVSLVQPLVVTETMRSEASLEYNKQNSKSDFKASGTRFNIVDDNVQDVALGYALTNYGHSSVVYQKHSYVRGYSKSTPEMSVGNSQHYGFYKFNGLYQKLYKGGQALNLRADAQWSGSKGMVSSRQFYMGGMYSVRGYKENYLGGDSGFVTSVEYQVPVFNKNTAAFTFWDYGKVYSNGQSANDDSILSSVGLGMHTTLNGKYSARLTLGVPLHRQFATEKVSSARLHFMLTGQF